MGLLKTVGDTFNNRVIYEQASINVQNTFSNLSELIELCENETYSSGQRKSLREQTTKRQKHQEESQAKVFEEKAKYSRWQFVLSFVRSASLPLLKDLLETYGERKLTTFLISQANALPKAGAGGISKYVPVVGAFIGIGLFAFNFWKGNYRAGILNLVSGGLSVIPGWGTLASVSVDFANAILDICQNTKHLEATQSTSRSYQ